MSKTVPPSKFQEWKGLDRISLTVHEMKCIFREISKDDFGIDGEIEIVVPKPDGNGYQITGGIIKVQAKSGMSYVKQDSALNFTSPVSKKDLEQWYNANYPTIYVVYHPEDDKLYWKEIRSYVRTTANVWQPPFKITFNKATDEFNRECFDNLCAIASTSPPRISHDVQERLFSNLLRIRRLPWVWSAPTKEKSYEEVRNSIQGFIPPFNLIDERLYSLSDLNNENCVLREYCDTSEVCRELTDTWWQNTDQKNGYVFMLNQLLGIHLRRLGIKYNRHFKRNYFPREDDEELEFKRGWYSVRTKRHSPSRIIVKYYEYGLDKFWRHKAANLGFRMIGTSWFLQIIPKYFFTTNGQTPYDSSRVGALTTKIKSDEENLHALNDVLFWADVLSGTYPDAVNRDRIKIKLDDRWVMSIEKLPTSGIASFSIPFDPAIYEEPEPTGQLSFDWFDQEDEDEDVY